MNIRERQLLQKNIDAHLERLQKILAFNRDHQDEKSESQHDESVRLDVLNHIAMDEAMINIALQERARLLANADWIHTDEAGLCQLCKTEIPIQRLMMVPTTRFCIECAVDKGI